VLDEKIEKGPANLRLLRPGEVITVNDIDIQTLNPEDKKRLPKSKRATVILGPITSDRDGDGSALGASDRGQEGRREDVAR